VGWRGKKGEVATERYRDEYGVILHDEDRGLLELRWLETSAGMTDDDFMRSMERYAALAQEHRTPFMLVDVTNFKHTPGEHVAGWRDEHIIPGYNSAGVRRFAFLLPEGAPGTVESGTAPAPEPPGRFPTGYFADRRRVLDWFDEGRNGP
jgi:hypothetical protein